VRRFLIGTAGHIDHGKTALVKALTGIDADRLPEEKRRGITIDLGFAHAEWEGVRISFVDVPGHERFVRNMLAGAGGVEAILLVVAADESVMPQTREHFEIVRLLGVERGVIALTKIDRVGSELVEVTRSDVAELVRGSFLENAAVVPVSSRTGEGLEALKAALLAAARGGRAEERETGPPRLPIDRAFLIAGFGPVVTGSLVAGAVSRDQRLELLPARRSVRVRRVEVHGREQEVARAGERVSVNLVGAELPELRRGFVLAAPDALPISRRLWVRLELLPTAPTVQSGDRLSLHHFSAETRAGVRILGATAIEPGASGFAEMRLASPLAAVPGDRFVVRRLSPVETIGGGTVLDPLPSAARSRRAPELAQTLGVLEGAPLGERLALWISEARERGASEDDLARRAGISVDAVRTAIAPLARDGRLHVLRRSPERYISEDALRRVAERSVSELRKLISAGGAVGVPRRTLTQRILPGVDARWAEAVESALAARGALVIAGEEARLPGRSELEGSDRELSERIATLYRERALDPPSPGETAETLRHRPKVVEGLISYLIKKGTLIRLPGGWIISRDALDQVVARLRESGKRSFDVGEFKGMFELTRKLAIPLLEHLDATKVTRRIGDRREIVG